MPMLVAACSRQPIRGSPSLQKPARLHCSGRPSAGPEKRALLPACRRVAAAAPFHRPVPPGPGTLPQIVRDAFFLTNGKLGVAAQVFVKGARPWV